MDHPFRTAAVGGFNRQDVLSFLETTTREAAERQQSLQQQLDEALEAGEQKEQELEQLRGQTEELEQLRARLSETEQALEESRSREAERSALLEAARQEARELQAQVDTLKPGAEAYDSIKERTAGVELEAHHRAQLVRREAQEQAGGLHRQMEQWMQQVEREYAALRSEVESTVAHAANQLSRAEESLGRVNTLMGEQEIALKTMAQAYAESNPNRGDAAPNR